MTDPDIGHLAWYRGCMPLNLCYRWCWGIARRDIEAGTAADLLPAVMWAATYMRRT
jgi:hypothetical protein